MSMKMGADVRRLQRQVAALEAENKALSERLEALEAKRGPGRPPKSRVIHELPKDVPARKVKWGEEGNAAEETTGA
jgi:hypothetical protein